MQVTEGQILTQARQILAEIAVRCPQYATKLASVRFEVSARMKRSAGRAEYFPPTVKLSLAYYADQNNFEKHFRNTVTHELAHLVVGVEGRGNRPHGPQWKRVHRYMGGTGARCHNLQLADGFERQAPRPREAVACWKCGQALSLGPTQAKRHRRSVALGGKGYRHKKCG